MAKSEKSVPSEVTRAEAMSVLSLVKKANDNGIRFTPLIHGRHGIGKTELVKQFAEANDMDCVVLLLATQEPSDLLGLPHKDEKTGETINLPPKWFNQALRNKRKTIYFLDEINRAPMFVLQTMFEFALNGKFHDRQIKEGDMVVAAMNPDIADYSVTTIEDKALISRFCHMYLNPTIAEWLTYTRTKVNHKGFMKAVSSDNQCIADVSIAANERISVQPDRRSLLKLGQASDIFDMQEMKENNAFFNMMAGCTGRDYAQQVWGIMLNAKTVTAANVLDGSVMKMFEKGEIDITTDLDAINSINGELIDILVNHCQGKGKSLTSKQIKNSGEYVTKQNSDIGYAFLRDIKLRVGTGENSTNYVAKVIDLYKEMGVDIGKVVKASATK